MSSEGSPCPTQQEIMCKHTGTQLLPSCLPASHHLPSSQYFFKNPYDPFEMGQIEILKYGVPSQETSLNAC